jgi:hypothetical protein
MLAIDQGQKCIGGFEMAKYLQQRLNLWNVAPERQKTALGAFFFRDKKQEGAFAIVCSREPKAGTIFSTVLATIPPAPLVACRDCGDCSTLVT